MATGNIDRGDVKSSSTLSNPLGDPERTLATLQRVLTTPYPIAQTPKEVIWTLNKAKLYHYIPTTPPPRPHPVPLLLIFALMNRPSILDLRPGNSFVEYMVGQRYDVYLLDWGMPGLEDRNLSFDDYVLSYLPRAIRKLKSFSGAIEFSLLGWCMGALITTMYAALRPDDGLRNLILLTAPLDFSDRQCGGFMRWASDQYLDLERLVARFGNVPGELLDYGAKALKPYENYVGHYVHLWQHLDDPKVVESWHAMNTWVNDLIPLPGAVYRQLIEDFYRRNRLITNSMTLRGETVDLRRVRANLLAVLANEDHIVPPQQTEHALDAFGSSDKRLLRIPGGHIGMMAGSGAVHRTWPQIEGWLKRRSGRAALSLSKAVTDERVLGRGHGK
jgi:polyhydroxyalkanoate synthase